MHAENQETADANPAIGRANQPIAAAVGLLLALTGFGPQPATGSSQLSERLIDLGTIRSDHVMPRRVQVWLPREYAANPSMRFPVLYMHDGQNLFDAKTSNFDQEWRIDETLTELVAAGAIPPTLVVGAWSTPMRAREYTPDSIFRFLPEDRHADFTLALDGDPLGDGYVRFLVEELKPMIDRRFRTRTGPETTAIIGSSRGGVISLHAGLHRPDVFGAVGALSVHWPIRTDLFNAPPDPCEIAAVSNAWRDWIADSLNVANGQRFYIDHGDQHLDRFYGDYQAVIRQAFEALAAHPERITLRSYPGTGHNETAWADRAADPLRFLLAPMQSTGPPVAHRIP